MRYPGLMSDCLPETIMSFCHSSLDKLRTFLDGSLVVKPRSAEDDRPDGFLSDLARRLLN
jgi:hypothetical protein